MNAIQKPVPPRSPSRYVRAVVGSIFVASLAALVVLDVGIGSAPPTGSAPPMAPAYLHAPATDPSLPAADAVFASRPAAAEAPPATF